MERRQRLGTVDGGRPTAELDRDVVSATSSRFAPWRWAARASTYWANAL